MTPKRVGIAKKASFEPSQISKDEEVRLIDVCNKIRSLNIHDLSDKGLLKAHDIITGGASLPEAIRAINKRAMFILDELDIITRNPPPTRTYINKLEKVYATLRAR